MSPAEVVLVVTGVLVALAVGSFTGVVVDRLPLPLSEPNEYRELWDTRPWREVVSGSSRCDTCAAPVRWRDNVPLLSWLALRGRCRDCGERIPATLPLLELAVPVLGALAVWVVGWGWEVAPVLWFVPVGLAVAAIDLRTQMVPTRIVWPAFAVTVALTVVAAAVAGEWSWLLSAAVGLVAFAAPLFAVWFVVPAGMGFGDVRLATMLGWLLGFAAAGRPMGSVVLVVLALALASIVGVVVGVVALGARGRKARVPFGPFLVVATYACILLAPTLLEPFDLALPA